MKCSRWDLWGLWKSYCSIKRWGGILKDLVETLRSRFYIKKNGSSLLWSMKLFSFDHHIALLYSADWSDWCQGLGQDSWTHSLESRQNAIDVIIVTKITIWQYKQYSSPAARLSKSEQYGLVKGFTAWELGSKRVYSYPYNRQKQAIFISIMSPMKSKDPLRTPRISRLVVLFVVSSFSGSKTTLYNRYHLHTTHNRQRSPLNL